MPRGHRAGRKPASGNCQGHEALRCPSPRGCDCAGGQRMTPMPVMPAMPKYRSHKEVWALKIKEIVRQQMPKFHGATCCGCYALGTACGHCERCKWERQRLNQGLPVHVGASGYKHRCRRSPGATFGDGQPSHCGRHCGAATACPLGPRETPLGGRTRRICARLRKPRAATASARRLTLR